MRIFVNEILFVCFKPISIEIRKEWLRKRLSNISVADDFNYDLILAQTKSWPIAEVDQLIRLTIEAAYWRSLE